MNAPDGTTEFDPRTHFAQPKITGYRQLTPNETELINDIKAIAVKAGTLVESLGRDDSIDQRWLDIAKTDLQKGFMSLVRSVAKPESF